MSIILRLIDDNEGALFFQELQRQVWVSPEDDLVPLHVSITVARNGGGLLGAYADNGPAETGGMVGATLWWLGIDDPKKTSTDPARAKWHNQLKVCSHMAGVLPGWQGKGIGRQMKLAQREMVLAQGLTDRITWTYDPLFVPNAIFNMNRLGTICTTYYPNYYGEMRDGLNRGTPSDRCQVDWLLNSPKVVQAATGEPETKDWSALPLAVLPVNAAQSGFQTPVDATPSFNGDPIAVPLPDDIAAIRHVNSDLALRWRLYVREMLQSAIAAGYAMVDCVKIGDGGYYYILEAVSS